MKLICLVGVATLVATTTSAADVKFVNSGNQIAWVTALFGAGDCSKKPERARFGLGHGQERAIADSGSSVCYLLSYFENENQPPYAYGEAKAGATIDLSKPPQGNMFHVSAAPGSPAIDWPISSTPHARIPPTQTWNDPVRIEYVVAIWRDPFTLPHTKTECTSLAWGEAFGQKWSFCNGYSTQCQWMERRLVLTVEAYGVTPNQLNQAVDKCLKQAAVAGALSAVVGAVATGQGAPAAEAAFSSVLSSCLVNELGPKLINIKLDNRGGWTDWVGC